MALVKYRVALTNRGTVNKTRDLIFATKISKPKTDGSAEYHTANQFLALLREEVGIKKMLRPGSLQLWRLSSHEGLNEGARASFQKLSACISIQGSGPNGLPGRQPPEPKADLTALSKLLPKFLLMYNIDQFLYLHHSREYSTSSTYHASDSGQNRSYIRPNSKATEADAPRPRPRRVIDARSFAAPRTGSQAANVLRAPRLQTLRSTQLPRLRGSKPATMAASPKTRSTNQRNKPRRAAKQSEEEEGDELRAAEIEEVYRQLAEEQRPEPVRYDPPEYDIGMLQETWPALPIGEIARAGSVLEKLSRMSDRYPNGYEPPYELAKRLLAGKRVLFSSELEKNEVMTEAKRLAQERADRLTQQRAELVEPKDPCFEPISAEERSILIQDLVQGKYQTLKPPKPGEPTVIGDVLRSLDNNETYRMVGKQSQFMKKLESLLASGKRSMRA